MNSKIKKIKLCKTILSIILIIDLIAFLILGFSRIKPNLFNLQEVWVNEENRSEVQEFAASLGFPEEDIVRVVYMPGLGDGEAIIHYKNRVLSTSGKCFDPIFSEYGEIEGTRTSRRTFIVLLIILLIDLFGKKIINSLINDVSEMS